MVNSSPLIARDHNVNYFHRAIRLLCNGTFDMTKLVTHRHPLSQVKEAMELAAERPPDYIKGLQEICGLPKFWHSFYRRKLLFQRLES